MASAVPAAPSVAEGFWAKLVEGFHAACASTGLIEHDLRIAGVGLRLRFAGPALEEALFPALAHLADHHTVDRPERTILLFDSGSSGVERPSDAWGPRDVGPLGELTGLDGSPLRGLVDGGYGGLQLFDRRSLTLAYHAPTEAGGAMVRAGRTATRRAALAA